jgi:nitrate/nitrite transporter NarK
MPRIVKSISTNSSSEIISSTESDSESSSSTSNSYGSGEEGSSDSSTNVAHTRTPSEQYLLPLDVRCCIGMICPIGAVGGTVLSIMFGMELNNPTLPNQYRVETSLFFAASAVVACVNSALSMLLFAKHPDPNHEVTAA